MIVQPAVAFANIGELALDVLVCTLKAHLAARLDDDNLLACAGNNAYSLQPPGLLATALELYQVPGGRHVLLCSLYMHDYMDTVQGMLQIKHHAGTAAQQC